MKLTIDNALHNGIEAHKSGDVYEADKYYTAILQVQPKHPDANHNLGVLAVGLGKVEQSLPFFKIALEEKPTIVQFWSSYIDALIKLGRIIDARVALDQAKKTGIDDKAFTSLERHLPFAEKSTDSRYDSRTLHFSDILDELDLTQALRLAKRKYKDGIKDEAEGIYRKILNKFPKNKRARDGLKLCSGGVPTHKSKKASLSQEKLQSLINLFNEGKLLLTVEKATLLMHQYPESTALYNIIGRAHATLKQYDVAIENFEKAITINPRYAEAYYFMAHTFNENGNSSQAVANFKKALEIKPTLFEASYNLGIVLYQEGDFKGAIYNYKQAIKIKPDLAEAHYNLGKAYRSTQNLTKAMQSYRKAIEIKPNYAEAYNNLGSALNQIGDFEGALNTCEQAIRFKPKHTEAYYNIGIALRGFNVTGKSFSKEQPNLHKIIIQILHHKTYVRPADIAPAVIKLLKFESGLKIIFEIYLAGKLKQSLKKVISELSKMPLFLTLLTVCPLSDLRLELILTELRSALLSPILLDCNSKDVLMVQSALALQCFTNEYIYNQTNEESRAVETLKESVSRILLKGQQPSPHSILCLASYEGLSNFEWAKSLAPTSYLREVLIRQVIEPIEESSLKLDIPILSNIADPMSAKVREQYEENPYPRWVNLGLPPKPYSLAYLTQFLNLNLSDPIINKVESPTILIAGCGTGQHSIGTASLFENCTVLAIDLSLSSLAYAKRKTKQFNIKNIDYMQADLLDLRKLNQKFDIVESIGVLHHMENPMAGWKVLCECLKPGGLMHIGLYSELARKHHEKIQLEINQENIGANDLAMKQFRNNVIHSAQSHHKKILQHSDFYSLSTLRDLLFHVQEHRFTLLQIKNCLSELGLKFSGFPDYGIVKAFKLEYPAKSDAHNLDKWIAYEANFPSTFKGMYQFWCQKL